jgi:hypothetical protein
MPSRVAIDQAVKIWAVRLDQYAVDHQAVDYFVDATGVRW